MALTNHTPEEKVSTMFNQIADNYDKMNSLISLGTHKHWRKVAMKQLHVKRGAFAIDVCCGTGDWTIALAEAVGPAGHVVGLDFSEKMLEIARKKVISAGFQDRVTLVQGDAMHLPYDDRTFDVATIGFGLRNVPDANQVLRELYSVIVPGALAACLETSQPTQPVVKLGWQAYFNLVPKMAKLAVNKEKEYAYLQKTTAEFVSAEKLADMFSAAGFKAVHYRTFDLGAAALHIGARPYKP